MFFQFETDADVVISNTRLLRSNEGEDERSVLPAKFFFFEISIFLCEELRWRVILVKISLLTIFLGKIVCIESFFTNAACLDFVSEDCRVLW